MKKVLLLIYCILHFCLTYAQNIIQAEYFIDSTALGIGQNNLINLTPLPDGNFSFNIDLSSVSPGYHKLYMRTKDENGKWSQTSRRNIEVLPVVSPVKIIRGEYFFDEDPRFGEGNPISVSPQDSLILQDFDAVTASLTPGYHKMYLRVQDNNGNWSFTARRNIEVIKSETYLVVGAEYFFNTDPGFGSARPVIFAPAADGSFSFNIPLSEIPEGAHTLYIRARDSSNHNWSITQYQRDSVVTTVQSGLWSQPATWSNNKIPNVNTIAIILHQVTGDINGVCRSLVIDKRSQGAAELLLQAGKTILVAGY